MNALDIIALAIAKFHFDFAQVSLSKYEGDVGREIAVEARNRAARTYYMLCLQLRVTEQDELLIGYLCKASSLELLEAAEKQLSQREEQK